MADSTQEWTVVQGAFGHDVDSEGEARELAAQLNEVTGSRPPAEVKTRWVPEWLPADAPSPLRQGEEEPEPGVAATLRPCGLWPSDGPEPPAEFTVLYDTNTPEQTDWRYLIRTDRGWDWYMLPVADDDTDSAAWDQRADEANGRVLTVLAPRVGLLATTPPTQPANWCPKCVTVVGANRYTQESSTLERCGACDALLKPVCASCGAWGGCPAYIPQADAEAGQ